MLYEIEAEKKENTVFSVTDAKQGTFFRAKSSPMSLYIRTATGAFSLADERHYKADQFQFTYSVYEALPKGTVVRITSTN